MNLVPEVTNFAPDMDTIQVKVSNVRVTVSRLEDGSVHVGVDDGVQEVLHELGKVTEGF